MRWQQQLPLLSLSGIAVSAAITDKGMLEPVGQIERKIDAALARGLLPRAHTLVISNDQKLTHDSEFEEVTPNIPHVLRFKGLGACLHIIKAGSLGEAIERLVVDHETRWGPIPDYRTTLEHHRGYIGREWLRELVLDKLEQSPRSHLFLEANPGVGKSAFSAEMIRSVLPARGHLCVHHLFSRPTRTSAVEALERLCTQLRRLAGIPLRPESDPANPLQMLENLLEEIGDAVPEEKRLVLWIDGVDEALWGQIAFPRHLPPRIKAVFTGRPDARPDWLADPVEVETVPLDHLAGRHPDDIRRYLDRENQARQLGLDDEFVQRLTETAHGNFMLAICYVTPRDTLHDELRAWQRDPRSIPRSVTNWLDGQWERLCESAGGSSPTLSEEGLRVVLGLLASGMEPLSRDHLQTFLCAAEESSLRRIGTVNLATVLAEHERVLRLARGFFEPLDGAAGAAAVYRAFHPDFTTYLRNRLTTVEKKDCHTVLASGCLAVRDQDNPPAVYAKHYCLAHLIAAEDRAGAAAYYSRDDLDGEELNNATQALAEKIIAAGSAWPVAMLANATLSDEQRGRIANRYLYDLLDRIENYTQQDVLLDVLNRVEDVFSRLHKSDPGNTRTSSDVAICWMRLGDLYFNTDIDKAGSYYEQALEIAQRLYDSDRRNAGYARDLSVSFNKLGDLYRNTDIDRARQYYEQALEIRQRLYDSDRRNAGYARDLSISYERLGDLYRNTDIDQARQYYEQALEIAQRLYDSDRRNAGYARDLSVSYELLGDLYRDTDIGQARQYYEKALEIRQPLFDAFPQNYELARELLVPLERLARLQEGTGEKEKAQRYWLRLRDLLRTIRERDWPLSSYWRSLLNDLGGQD